MTVTSCYRNRYWIEQQHCMVFWLENRLTTKDVIIFTFTIQAERSTNNNRKFHLKLFMVVKGEDIYGYWVEINFGNGERIRSLVMCWCHYCYLGSVCMVRVNVSMEYRCMYSVLLYVILLCVTCCTRILCQLLLHVVSFLAFSTHHFSFHIKMRPTNTSWSVDDLGMANTKSSAIDWDLWHHFSSQRPPLHCSASQPRSTFTIYPFNYKTIKFNNTFLFFIWKVIN